jgi:hypothetical protein
MRGYRGRAVLTTAIVLALVVGGGLAILTGRIAVAAPVQVDANGYLNETTVSPYAFVTRGFEMLPLHTKVTVILFNGDTTGATHTFTLLNWTNRTIPTSDSTGDIGQLIHLHGTLANVSSGGEASYMYQNFTSPTVVGYYEFVCLVAGHFSLGMWGYVAFGEALPSNLSFATSSPGPGLAVFIIVGTIVALTVLAIVLGFVVGQRRGAEHEMPPERLGYPEPTGPEPLASTPPRTPGPP